MPAEMTSQERVRTAIGRKQPDRVPIYDDLWQATIERWRREGLPKYKSPEEHFGYDLRQITADLTPRLPIKVLKEDEEYVTETTPWGGVRRNHKDRSTTPELIECPVKTKDDWTRLRKLLEPSFTRVNWANALRSYRTWREEGRYIYFSVTTGYDRIQGMMRTEELLTSMAEDPEWISEIVMSGALLAKDMLEMMHGQGLEFDALWCYNDMGYRNSSLFSPRMYREMIQPADKLLWDTAHGLKMQTILHSCGRVIGLIPDLLDAGLDCLQPLEVKAGMDPATIKKQFGARLAMMGGIDTRCLENPDPTVIEREIRTKFSACMPGGGYIYHTDHSVPNDVSFERYCHVMELVRKYGQYGGTKSEKCKVQSEK